MNSMATRSMRDVVLMTRNLGASRGSVEPTVVWMSDPVAAHLRTLGFNQPVPLDELSNKWWSIAVDVAAMASDREPGCGYCRTVTSSEAIGAHHAMFWCEIEGGPFDSADDAQALYLVSSELDVSK